MVTVARRGRCLSDETLLALVEARLGREQLPDLEAHLASCDVCAGVFGKVAAFVNSIGASRPAETSRASSRPRSLALRRVDPRDYDVLREIARGGMGRILEAIDRRHDRRVAIKVLLQSGASAMRRFEREAAITARLQHPSIIPLYEAGRWEDGEPFFAMKLVAGKPLSRVMEERRTLAERLALLPNLIAVTEALAYAHERRIVHRDLKPSNVLVGAFGETVVIDWGLAKVLDEHPDHADALSPLAGGSGGVDGGLTLAGSAVGTPCYMPPEQARGEPVDERADVYALGAILYQLFAGAPPHVGSTPEATVASVVGGPPEPLARRAPQAPRDLVALVEKAMARDPADRYPDAKAVAEDLGRFTAGQLVSAHAYSATNLLARWGRRHRAAVSAGALLAVILTVGGGASVRRIARERDRADAARVVADRARGVAETHRDAAEHLVEFMIVELRTRLEALGRLDVLGGVGEEVERYYRSVETSSDALEPSLLNRRAVALETLAGVEERKENDDAAITLLESAIRTRQAAIAKLPEDEPSRMAASDILMVGTIEESQGKRDRAMGHYEQVRAMAEAATTRDPKHLKWSYLLARSTAKVARLHRDAGDAQASRSLCAGAVEVIERVVPPGTTEKQPLNQLGWAYFELGDAEAFRGDLAAAAAAYDRCLSVRNRLAALDPQSTEWRRNVAWAKEKVGSMALLAGDYPKAVALLEEAISIRGALVTTDPANTMWGSELAQTEGVAADALRAVGRYDDAIRVARTGVAIVQRLATATPDARDVALYLLAARRHLGEAELLRSPRAAEVDFEAALVAATPMADKDQGDVEWGQFMAETALDEARAALSAGDVGAARARTALDRGLAILGRSEGHALETERLRAEARELQGEVSAAQGDGQKAIEAFVASEQTFGQLAQSSSAASLVTGEARALLAHAHALAHGAGLQDEATRALVARGLELLDGAHAAGRLTVAEEANRAAARTELARARSPEP